jgi:hypothetical protein
MYDYRFKTTNLPLALLAIDALRDAGVLSQEGVPQNMLGDPLPGRPDLLGRQGRAGGWVTPTEPAPVRDPVTSEASGETAVPPPYFVPAVGEPGAWYFAIRSEVPPETLLVDPALFGLVAVGAEESAEVLGVWA